MYELNKIAFGSFLAQLRREKGMTQKELAACLYVSDKAVSKWERGLSVPDISLLVPLAEQLNVTVAELLQGCRVEEEQRFTREETEELIRKALTFSAEPPGTPPGPYAEVSAAVWGQRGAWPCRDRSCLGRGAGRDRGRNDAADYKRDLRHRIWGLHLVLDAGNIAALL